MKPRSLWRNVIGFLGIWLMVGFFSGTSTLLGPVRWITDYSRGNAWTDSAEKSVVLVAIALYVLLSAVVAWFLNRIVQRTAHRHIRFGVPALVLCAASASLWMWMHPTTLGADMGVVEELSPRFTFGPYPDLARMEQLKAEGYDGIITLLHPAVVPFEPKLLAEEEEAAAAAGLALIHAPMLPWVSENQESLDRILDLAQAGSGRYYVHCYLGKDRVNTVRRLLERTVQGVEVESHVASRSLLEKGTMERGKVEVLAEDVVLTPYPTDEEFLAYILAGDWQCIVSLMDPDHEADRKWIEKERKILEQYHIRFEVVPLPHGNWDPAAGLEAVAIVWNLPRPLLVHSFLAPSTGKSATAQGFMQSFRSGLPALPPSKLARRMHGGPTEVLAPNIATGPPPTRSEFAGYLYARGVRRVLFIAEDDSAGSKAADSDRKAAEAAGLTWEAVDRADPGWVDRLQSGGPWYLYGHLMKSRKAEIVERFGPAVPASLQWTGPEKVDSPDPPDPQATDETDERQQTQGMNGSVAGEPPGSPGFSSFLVSLVPTFRQVVLIGPVLLLYASFAAGFAGWLRIRQSVRTPYTRKIFHFFIFTTAGVLHLTGGLSLVALFGGLTALVVLYAVWRGDDFPFYESMARPTDAPRRTLFILVPLTTTAAGGLLSNLFFGPFAIVGYLVGGWGDAVGEPVGTAFGKHRYKVPSLGGVAATRSYEGSAAVFAVGVAAAALGLWPAGLTLGAVALTAFACGLAGALVESVSNHGLDNLTIQLAAAGTAWLFLG